jgi:hypothetical protein
MNGIAVTQVNVKTLIVSLVGAAILLFALVGTAGAASPVGKDGKIHACYRVKGKPKGGLRIVPQSQKRCKRGERKVAWSASTMTGVPGVNGTAGNAGGQSGSNGSNGAGGTNGTNGTEVALKNQITDLTLKLEGLEGILNGVTHSGLLGAVDAVKGLTNDELLGAVDTVEGLTNGDLLGAVGVSKDLLNADPTAALNSLPVVKSLCEGTKEATKGVNELEVGVKGLTILGLPGLSLGGLGSLPGAVDSFSCVTP